jgi:DNA-binding transcriptional ArsR family regulator
MRRPSQPAANRDPYQNADDAVPKCGYVRSPLLSPHNDSGDTWDPSSLSLSDVALTQATPRRGRRVSPVRGKFIAGPVDIAWLSEARKLGVTALWVGLGLWFLRGLRHSDTNIASNLIMLEFGVQPDAKSRALRKLEKAGLITIERRGKRSPRVTLVVQSTFESPALTAEAEPETAPAANSGTKPTLRRPYQPDLFGVPLVDQDDYRGGKLRADRAMSLKAAYRAPTNRKRKR